ncbi:MAG: molybdopterin-dependent oxidoreductase, partial [Proteobacteria bacterium]|nr:molybdopterin-dependent oxidoreductase [Pseudomonadota bacterium]
MANKKIVSTQFRIVALITATLLLMAAALVYLQGVGGNSSAAELAALSQAVPGYAKNALQGEAGAYDVFAASVTRVAELRRAAGPAAPGSSDQWQSLMSRASIILDKRDVVNALHSAAAGAEVRADSIVQMSDGLLDRAGSTAIGGSAVKLAGDKIIAKGMRIAAHLLEAAEADIEFTDGAFAVAGTDRRIGLIELARESYVPGNLPPGIEPGLDE